MAVTDLLSKWLVHYDPIHRGWTPRGIAGAVCTTRGYGFARVGGGYNLYRGVVGSGIDFSSPVGAAGFDATQIKTFEWRGHSALTQYRYALRSVGGGGVESDPGPQGAVVSFDGTGVAEALRPNGVTNPSVHPVSGGAFALSWDYDPRGQEAVPVEFRVFDDGGTGVIDFMSVIGSVAYAAGVGRFGFTTGSFASGAVRLFAVRAVAADGTTDGSTAAMEGVADGLPPVVHPEVFVSLVDGD